MRKIFFDHISTTPTDPRVVEEMLPYFTSQFGNPSSLFYEHGQQAAKALEEARAKVAGLIGAEAQNIIFTSGATEANNMAIKGIAWANEDKGRHIILSDIEHFSVLFAAQALSRWGFEITRVPVDSYGIIDLGALKASIRADTILISIMHANNEIGTIEPIVEIANIAREKGILFHADAVGTVGIIPVNVGELGVDALTLAGHSFYGPFIARGLSGGRLSVWDRESPWGRWLGCCCPDSKRRDAQPYRTSPDIKRFTLERLKPADTGHPFYWPSHPAPTRSCELLGRECGRGVPAPPFGL